MRSAGRHSWRTNEACRCTFFGKYSGAAAAGTDIMSFIPTGYMSEALAIQASGRCGRAGTNVEGYAGALNKDFIRDWTGG
ncbi:hypothetical protein DPMN_118496 [Dreissena polymorpha]|uniref:Uncharacterized protein n=1 Tax=Dreissena polymorpha TaxID=45954 RepID=A0A9D4GK77_DREPO|nr:hypothetical protein DPMN_118496 [Dreissena polymorpha]